MFEFVRRHQKLMQMFLLILIVPSFAFWGISSFTGTNGNGPAGIATIAGQPVTQQDFDDAQRAQMERFGPDVDPKQFATPAARAQILETLIDQRVLLAEIPRQHLAVSNQRVAFELAQNPALKQFYRPDGSLDTKAYDAFLFSHNLTRDQLFDQTRRDLLYREITGTIPQSSVTPKSVATRLAIYLTQQRDVQEQQFKPAEFVSQVKLAPDAAQKYYDTHPKEFEVPEHVDVSYIVLSLSDLAAKAQITPKDIQAYYDAPENQHRYQVAEQRRASHILIAVPADATDAVKQKARARADALLAQVRAKPDDFAKLAKENSDDTGSKDAGGDLGWAPSSNYVPAFADALNKLKDNEISDVVTTNFGYHIIHLTGIRAANIKPIDTVRADIEQELRRRQAQKDFSGLEDSFQNLVYEQADSLNPAAEKLGLKVQTALGIGREPDPKAPPGSPLAQPKFLSALFTDDVLKNKHNSAAVEAGPGQMIAAHVDQYHASAQRPFAEVQTQIVAKITDDESRRLAKRAGEARLAEAQKNGSDAGFSAVRPVSRSAPADFPADAVPDILKADVTKLPAYVGVTLNTGVYAVYKIVKVEQGAKGNVPDVAEISRQLATQFGTLDFASYVQTVKKLDKVKITPEYQTPDAVSTGSSDAPSGTSSPSAAK